MQEFYAIDNATARIRAGRKEHLLRRRRVREDRGHGHTVRVLAEQLDLLVADAAGAAGVGEFGRQVGGESQTVVDVGEQDGAGVARDSMIGLTDRLQVGLKSYACCSPMSCLSRSVRVGCDTPCLHDGTGPRLGKTYRFGE